MKNKIKNKIKSVMLSIIGLFATQHIYAQTNTESFNFGFEQLDSNSTSRFLNWDTNCGGGWITDDAYEGKQAARIATWYVNLKGCLSLGKRNGIKGTNGLPFTGRPTNLRLHYKYEYGDNCGFKDSCEISVYLRKQNFITNQNDTIGKGKIILGPKSVYTPIVIPINYANNLIPDTLSISFISDVFDKPGYACRVGTNRFLTVDNLSLDLPVPISEVKDALNITIFPNPTNNLVEISWQNTLTPINTILLKDKFGRVIQKKSINTEGVLLDLSSLPKGVYFIEFNQNGKHIATKKVVKQ
jgi:hypothetical protein